MKGLTGRNGNFGDIPMYSRWLLIILVASLFTITAAQENPVDLDFQKALDMALARSGGLQAKAKAVNKEEFRVGQAKAENFPKLDIYSNYARTSLSAAIEFQNPLTGVPMKIDMFPEDRYNFGAALSREIYSFGRTGAMIEAAKSGLKRSEFEVDKYRHDLFDTVARVFSGLLLARDNLNLQKSNIEKAGEKLQIVEAAITLGKAAEFDRNMAKLLVAKYEDRQIQALEEFNRLKIRLKSLIHWNQQYEFMPVGEIAEFKASIPESLSLEEEDNTQMKMMLASRDVSLSQQTINKSAYYPVIAAQAKYEWQNGYQPDINDIRGDWTLGISFNWRIFDGGARKNKLGQARMESSRLESLIADIGTDLESRLEAARVSFETANRRLEIAQERQRLVESGMKIAESRYKQGLISISDLLDLELDRADAALSVLAARHGLLKAKLDIKASLEYYPELN